MKKYVKTIQQTRSNTDVMDCELNRLVLEGAKRMIEQALVHEIEEFRQTQSDTPYRNGYGKERRLSTPAGSFFLKAPRLREPFDSRILAKYQRTTGAFDALMPQLYLHGLSTNDFQLGLRAVFGEEAPLSPASIVRLKAQWKEDFQRWSKTKLEASYLYLWVDGVYPKAGEVDEPLCVLSVMGVNAKGEKKLLALQSGYRESYESWKALFRHLKSRGVQWIGLVISDGINGLNRALQEIFPHTRRQRCWVHKMRNILDHIPTKQNEEALEALRRIYNAPSLAEAKHHIQTFIRRYEARYPKATASLQEGLPQLLTYFQFPKEHWKSIKTTNPIESAFSSVRRRLKATGRIYRRDSALYLVFQLLLAGQLRWRKINKHKSIALLVTTMKTKNKTNYRIAA
jgi:transposase-like protein